MVGVAYLTADPSSPPYVTVGQTIAAGQTVMLIEAMKTFSQIKATKGGTVTQILVASGDPVEFGQPLIIVE
jgi:acetyl-CoA carboxylase biotin carboxyl carrier protein